MNKIKAELESRGFDVLHVGDCLLCKTDDIVCYIEKKHDNNCDVYLIRISTEAAFVTWSKSTAIVEAFVSEDSVVEYIRNEWPDILMQLLTYLSFEYNELNEKSTRT